MCFDTDYPSVFRESMPIARKEYVCCECRKPIIVGERHEYVFGVWSGEANTHRTCEFCVWMRDRVVEKEYEHGCGSDESTPAFGNLMAALSDGNYGMLDLLEYHER